jgi:hypothetical protein
MFALCVAINVLHQMAETSARVRVVPVPTEPAPTVQPNLAGTKRRLFLSDDDDEENTPKKPRPSPKVVASEKDSEELRDRSPTVERASPSPEPEVLEPPAGRRRKPKGSSAVSELDLIPQAVTKQGYPEEAYLLNGKIYIGVRVFCGFAMSPFANLSRS